LRTVTIEPSVNKVQIREADAAFLSLVAAAEQGQPTLITRRGQPLAMIVPVEAGQRLYPITLPGLAEYLLGVPESLETERDTTSLRDVDLREQH
jgi:prevent-host-death family protein